MRISVKQLREYPWILRLFFWDQKRRYGAILQPSLLWARVPRLFGAVSVLYGVKDVVSGKAVTAGCCQAGKLSNCTCFNGWFAKSQG